MTAFASDIRLHNMGDHLLSTLLIGAGLVCATIVVMVSAIAVAMYAFSRLELWLRSYRLIPRLMMGISGVVLWLMLALTASVWLWAGAFRAFGLFDTFEESLYFSVVAFTTVGFGDVVLGENWRLLSGLLAANGLILFSLVTAFLLEFISILRGAKAS